jgi:hypothetical protein
LNPIFAAALEIQSFCRARNSTCSAEDLLVLKVFAGRAKDWLDVEGVVLRQADRLDRALVRRELEPLLELKDDNMSLARLEKVFSSLR